MKKSIVLITTQIGGKPNAASPLGPVPDLREDRALHLRRRGGHAVADPDAATFIGSKVAGVRGATLATLGVVLPSFVIIVCISFVLEAFQHVKAVRYAFWGIRAGVLALILKALVSLYKQCKKDRFAYGIMTFAFLAVTFLHLNAIIVILICAALGLIFSNVKKVSP